MSYKSYTLGLHIPNGEANERAKKTPGNPTDPNKEIITANLGNLNPFWVGIRLIHIETLVECLH